MPLRPVQLRRPLRAQVPRGDDATTRSAIIADAGHRITYGQLHKRLVPALRSANYDQEPQLEGRDSFKRRQIFT